MGWGEGEAELNAMSLECLQVQTRQDPEGNRQVLENYLVRSH